MVKGDSLGEKLGTLTSKTFEKYGEFVGRHPGKILIATLLFTVLCLPGYAYLRINLDLYKLFVPEGAPVRFEFESQQAYDRIPPGQIDAVAPPPPSLIAPDPPAASNPNEIPEAEMAHNDELEMLAKSKKMLNETIMNKPVALAQVAPPPPIHTDILRFYIVHKNYENLLESSLLNQLHEYTEEMMHVTLDYKDRVWTLADFCKKEGANTNCTNHLNVWLKHAANLFNANGSRTNPNLQLSYPVMYLFNRPKDIGNIIYGVNVTGSKHEIVGARVLTIHWFISFPVVGNAMSAFFAFRQELNKFWDTKSEHSMIKFIPHNDKAMDDELRLIIETAVPFALPATLQLMLFVYFTNLAKDVRK